MHIEARSLRRTEPATTLPYKGYVRFGPHFVARETLSDIIPRVESDFGVGALDLLVALIDQFNSPGKNVETTHTGVRHELGARTTLLTGIILGPRGRYEWTDLPNVQSACDNFAQGLIDIHGQHADAHTLIFIGPIEIIYDPAGTAHPIYGMEFTVRGEGDNRESALAGWQQGVTALVEYLCTLT